MEDFLYSIIDAQINRDINNWWWELNLTIDEETYKAISYTYTAYPYERGVGYVGTCGEWVDAMVSTSNKAGFGGREFLLPMVDGTTAAVKGPWSGRPAVYMALGFRPYIEAHVLVLGKYRIVMGLTKEGVDAIIAKFNLPFHTVVGTETKWYDEEGGEQDGDREITCEIQPNDPNMPKIRDNDDSAICAFPMKPISI